jgi:hypothetical protein
MAIILQQNGVARIREMYLQFLAEHYHGRDVNRMKHVRVALEIEYGADTVQAVVDEYEREWTDIDCLSVFRS